LRRWRRAAGGSGPSRHSSRESRLAATLARLDELRQQRTIQPQPPSETPSFRERFRRWRRTVNTRADADDLFRRQQPFNDAVVQAFQAQDRLNRENIAELLLAMLELGSGAPAEPSWDAPHRAMQHGALGDRREDSAHEP
jgi:hypothetical protein